MRSILIVSLFVLTLIVGWTGTSWAQVTTANFYGTVTDPTGAVIPDATVTLIHEGTRATVTKTTNIGGEFVFDFLRVGGYTLRIEARGFKRYESKGIELTAGQQIRQTFVLEVGAVTETVNVEGTAPLVSTAAAQQLQTFESLKVTELPLGRRNYASILMIGTGVTSSGDSVRMNGIGRNGTVFSVDGTDAGGNPEGRNSSMYQPGSVRSNYIDIMSIEAIQEVNTIKGIVPAEFGYAVGGQVNLLTKSGTNRWHGSLFENFQAENLNARFQFLRTKPALTFNQFGGSLGGPIKHNKIFIFGVYEGYREKAFRLVQGNVLTQRFREEVLRAQPAYNALLQFFPLPNRPHAPEATIGLFLDAASSSASDNHADVKGDIQLAATSRLSLSYSRGRPSLATPRIYLNHANDRDFLNWQERGTASFITGGANWTSETRFGYNLVDMERWDRLFKRTDPPGVKEEFPLARRINRIITDFGFGTDDIELFLMEGGSWNLDQKYARHAGKHSLKFGGNYMRHCCQRTNPEAPWFIYATPQDLLNNVPREATPTFGSGDFRARMYEFGFFAQDDWRLKPNLVLNLGLRYDLFSNLVAKGTKGFEESGFYNPDGLSVDGRFLYGPIRPKDNPYEPDRWVNLGPRFGFSYNPDGKGRTVIRGGFGTIFSNQVLAVTWQSINFTQVIPFRIRYSRADAARLGMRYPMNNLQFRAIAEAEHQRTGRIDPFSIFNPHLQNPYSMHFTLGIQRELTPNLMLETALAGNRGVRFIMHRWANQVDRITGLRPNPLLGEPYYVDHSQQTVYTSWQTSLRKRYSRNLTGSLHYTWGKSLSTGGGDLGAYYQGDNFSRTQDFLNIKADRGPSTGDITHYFVSEWLYELPRFSSLGNGVARQALGGWQVSGIVLARTGEPLVIGQSGAVRENRPDYIGGAAVNKDYTKTLQYLNRAAFAMVPINRTSGATIRPGNVGNGAVRGPGMWNLDFSLAKNFSLTEQFKLQLRTDMFNVFNHTNLTGVDTTINSRRFGELTNTSGARVIQLNARLSW